jgi:hypothetical protein
MSPLKKIPPQLRRVKPRSSHPFRIERCLHPMTDAMRPCLTTHTATQRLSDVAIFRNACFHFTVANLHGFTFNKTLLFRGLSIGGLFWLVNKYFAAVLHRKAGDGDTVG